MDAATFDDVLHHSYGLKLDETPDETHPHSVQGDVDAVLPSRTSPLDTELAEASVEEKHSSSPNLSFVSRIRELSIDSMLEFARPFMRENKENIADQSIQAQSSGAIHPVRNLFMEQSESNNSEEEQIRTMSLSELETATDSLKEQILALPANAEENLRADLVQKLVLHRLKLQEIQDIVSSEPSSVQAMGHDFQRVSPLRKLRKMGKHCEVCGQLVIFAPHQSVCLSCGFLCHDRCINSISRQCVAEKIRSKPEFVLDICAEKGLDCQNFACAECKKPFPMQNPNVWDTHIRVCDYSGYYYCTICHRNDLEINPGRVVKNWDFSHRTVCRASFQTLSLLLYHPLLDVLELNKDLFAQVEELECVQKVRRRLAVLYRMMMDCQVAPQIALLHNLSFSRKHLLTKNFFYSMNDLIDINRGTLLGELRDFAGQLEDHVKNCPSCSTLKSWCIRCNDGDKLYPFEERALVCSKCSVVSHKSCSQENSSCPKCGFVESS